MIRLSKFIAGTGLCSRREAEKWIMDGRVLVNGSAKNSAVEIVSKDDDIVVDGEKISQRVCVVRPKIFAVHKLAGELVATTDPGKNRPVLFDRIKHLLEKEGSLKPVTRLEFNTEGLLLLTNNGELARMLENPMTGLERKYRIRLHGKITESKLDGFRRGLVIDKIKYGSMKVNIERNVGTNSWLSLSCIENKVSKDEFIL